MELFPAFLLSFPESDFFCASKCVGLIQNRYLKLSFGMKIK